MGGLHAAPPYSAATRGVATPSDFDLNPALLQDEIARTVPSLAAVLVPVVQRPELTLLLTQRTGHLNAHAGQISFPGGKIDAGDAGPAAAALRETEEEIGLDARFIETLGFLDPYRTGTGFLILPLVAFVAPGFALRPNPNEVADVFEVPLAFLMDPSHHRTDTRYWRGQTGSFYAMPYRDRYIWGATAGIIKNMHTRLFAP